MLFSEKTGTISVEKTSLSKGEHYTFLINKDAKSKKGILFA
jgi:hypothetical protein